MSNFLQPTPSVVAAYEGVRSRVIALLRTTPEADGDRTVPHCPAWTVRELAGHIVGLPEDILAGRMEGVTTDAWTQAQVERHRGQTLLQLADAFEATIESFAAILPHIPVPVNSQMVMDAVTHELDLRRALGNTDARDSDAVDVAVGWLLDMAENRSPGAGSQLQAARVSGFDLLRSLTGRRSSEQIDAIGLDASAIVGLLAGTPLKPPAESIQE